MSLAKVNSFNQDPIAALNLKEAIGRWEESSPSLISHHGRRCCALAREWIFSTDHAQLNGESAFTGPRWLRQRFNWGPSPWPIAWCEIVQRKVLDCGAFAALSHEIFSARGVRSFRAQIIQEFSGEATSQWLSKWMAEGISDYWITPGLIYHEVCAVETTPKILRLWDASTGWWSDTRRVAGYGAVRAVRVFTQAPPTADDYLIFDCRRVRPNTWEELKVFNPAQIGSETGLPLAVTIATENLKNAGNAA